ncbi:hypothetical protein PROFUN_01925 [Planoprotostelium fungivorum]|uniref:Uncharacterized protein n=1 Tax=Planoprotostelium fungivorum TaxID=1890364 RepID=A0A2P6NZ22_9EUKA|nr:hypothetical protein PROFUN_01925 [Planoprotostelium fungivorum]
MDLSVLVPLTMMLLFYGVVNLPNSGEWPSFDPNQTLSLSIFEIVVFTDPKESSRELPYSLCIRAYAAVPS